MARVTVEDCLKNVKNRFELVIIAARRARQLMRGKQAQVEWDNDKATVVALREIAAGHTFVETHDDAFVTPSIPEIKEKPDTSLHLIDEDDHDEE